MGSGHPLLPPGISGSGWIDIWLVRGRVCELLGHLEGDAITLGAHTFSSAPVSASPSGVTGLGSVAGRSEELHGECVGEEVRSTSSDELSKGSGPSGALSQFGLITEESVPRPSPSLSESWSSVLLGPPGLKSSQVLLSISEPE